MDQILVFILVVFSPLLLGLFGVLWSTNEWFKTFKKPYIIICIATYLVLINEPWHQLIPYISHLVVNLFSQMHFNLQNIIFAGILITTLTVNIVYYMEMSILD